MTRHAKRGFTLLEVVLTLAMAVVLMSLIAAAIQFYTRDMNVNDMDIRQTRLASVVMQMIEDDLRATLRTQPVDTAALEALLASTAGEDGGAGEDEDLSAAGIESEEETIEEPDTSTLNLQAGAAVLREPGLIGNQNQIQIDLSRLPRLEEYIVMIDGTTSDLDDVPSDIKTVGYFVQPAGMIGGIKDQLDALDPDSGTVAKGGLVRRSLDRAATVEAAMSGGLTRLNQTGDLLAPEVTAIEFDYWDGITWQLQWSSDAYGQIPLAIRVTLTMLDPIAERAMKSQGIGTTIDATRTFTHIVRLPLGRPVEEEEEEELSEAGI